MLKDSLIIMPFHLPWDHSADYQQQTCLVLHKQNLIICYMYHDARFFLKRKSKKSNPKIKNIIFYSPLYIIPFRRFAKIEKLNQLICILYLTVRYGVRKHVYLWLFDPMFYFYPKVRVILPWVKSLYDCVDYHWSRDPDETRILRTQEKQLIKNVNYFFVNSQILANIHKSVRRPDAILPLGFALDVFKKHEKDKLPRNLHFPHDKPIIGYIGSLNWRLDFKLLINLISKNPQWTFAFFGLRQYVDSKFKKFMVDNIKNLMKYKNVFYDGELSRNHIPGIIKQFDVCIIPYDVSLEFNRYCYPMKLIEYFYMGKPVLTTPIAELRCFPDLVNIGSTPKTWQTQINHFLVRPWPEQQKSRQRKLAIANSWNLKINSICQALEENSLNNT